MRLADGGTRFGLGAPLTIALSGRTVICRVKTLRHFWLGLIFATGVLRSAGDEVDDQIVGLGKVAIEGNYDYPIRRLGLFIKENPGEARYVKFRDQLIADRARAYGAAADPAAADLAVAATALPDIPLRRVEAGQAFTTGTAGVAMIWIPPGRLLMSAVQGSDDDTEVTLSRGYWLGRTEVTQAQWLAVMDNLLRPSAFRGAQRPVERISWLLAMEFCKKLDERERAAGRLPPDYEFSLPTEAQWEFACRAGGTGKPDAGLEAVAWCRTNSDEQTHPVGQKPPNAWGLYDMHGNVWEWCIDGYQGYPGGEVTDLQGDYRAPSSATFRIIRGGGWPSNTGECRSDYRTWTPLNTLNAAVGFRLALVPRRAR